MKISLKKLVQQAALVNSCVESVGYEFAESENEEMEDLQNSWDKLYSVILDIHETLDCLLSDIEK